MVKTRVKETDQGIQDPIQVSLYDRMMRRLRDRGWLETKQILDSGITSGNVLEVGPGPGYLGLEWLKKTSKSKLTGLDISPAMIELAKRNAREVNLEDRVTYVEGNALRMPFDDKTFDGVFSNGSLHEWEEPEQILNEIVRVLKPGGRTCITDLRRDMNPFIKWGLWLMARPKALRKGLISSIRAAYTKDEIHELLQSTNLNGREVKQSFIGLVIMGQKE